MTLEPHPFSQFLPPMEEEQYQLLKLDIQNNGQLHPIVLYENKILDGNHRFKICEELGLVCARISFNGNCSPLEYVQSVNLHRRHLTHGQRAAVALGFVDAIVAYRKKHRSEFPSAPRTAPAMEVEAASTRGIVSKSHNISVSAIGRISTIRGISKKLYNEVFMGTKKLETAWHEAKAMRPGGPKGGRKWKTLESIQQPTIMIPNVYVDWDAIWQMDTQFRLRGYSLMLERIGESWFASYKKDVPHRPPPCCQNAKHAIIAAAKEVI